jgi:CheY-like chemotaxis protein
MAALLQQADLSEEAREFASTISQSGRSLLELLNDVLDYSKIEAGRMELDTVSFSPMDILRNAASLVESAARTKGLTCRIELDDTLSNSVVGDPVRLRQVLYNLLSNAVKFTSAGEVALLGRLLPTEDSRLRKLIVSVKDTGIGMSPGATQRLFQPFLQADSSITRKYGGTGLGLAISRRLIELMQGTLQVESIQGQGSTFTLSILLPTAPETDSPTEPKLITSVAKDFKSSNPPPLRILLAEDNEINRKVARLMLAKLGQKPIEVVNGQEAVERCQREEFDLILLDLQMPVLDGLSAAKQIRASQSPLKKVPRIFAFTANAFVEDRQACLAAGMDGVLTKPVTLEQLHGLIVESDALPS